jgi:small GTP-binding protein
LTPPRLQSYIENYKMTNVKCVVLGDVGVGKTSLITAYERNEIPERTTDQIHCYSHTIQHQEQPIYVSIIDTRSEENEKERINEYSSANLFILCYSIINPVSFENITMKWYPEICRYTSSPTILLVGTHEDLRSNSEFLNELREKGLSPILARQGDEVARQIHAFRSMVCGFHDLQSIRNVFEIGVQQFIPLLPPPSSSSCCNVL